MTREYFWEHNFLRNKAYVPICSCVGSELSFLKMDSVLSGVVLIKVNVVKLLFLGQMGHSMSNQHTHTQKKNITLTDFDETWFLHSLSCDIHPHSVSAFYVAWLQS